MSRLYGAAIARLGYGDDEEEAVAAFGRGVRNLVYVARAEATHPDLTTLRVQTTYDQDEGLLTMRLSAEAKRFSGYIVRPAETEGTPQ